MLLMKCCIRKGRLFRRRSPTRPNRPRTGRRTAGCFASSLADCSADISREHFVSAAVLKLIGGEGLVHASGLPWQKGETKALSVNALASRILCSRHNNALSQLDSAAVQFFELLSNLRASHDRVAGDSQDTCIGVVNGHDLERWFLKAMIGGLYSGNMTIGGAQQQHSPPPQNQLEFLFGERSYLKGWGLYVLNPIEPVLPQSRYVTTTALSIEGVPAGILVQTVGFQFALGPQDAELPQLHVAMFRPSELIIKAGASEQVLAMSWEHPGGNRPVVLERHDVTP
jgi:hypothetical protein